MASTQTLQGSHFTSGSVQTLSQPPEEALLAAQLSNQQVS